VTGTSSQALPKYARFARRLRGLALDFILFLVLMVCALQIAVAFNQNDLARVLGFSLVIGFFLYEPLLVSLFGGTVGHYLSNIKVVDDRTNGNVSFLKAVGRVVIKTILGWYSFISMVATRRHQAVHDLLTRSTVQIRDPSIARGGGFAIERVELSSSGMPSVPRRIAIIVLYLLLVFVAAMLLFFALVLVGLISDECLRREDWCSRTDNLVISGLGLCMLIVLVLCLGFGWRGRLWGARMSALDKQA
jgi:hypothetical protein